MKRSTLTLSILTALLVSACGGSSSNDEQTKDPTPPKVTPTNPITPSTGRTPTTGKKETKKEEASSSASSSDPTPPISSGSAPSGGKPIVIAGEPKKENEDKGKGKTDENKGDGKTDEDQNKDKDKDKDKEDEKKDQQTAEQLPEAEQYKQSQQAADEAKLQVGREISDAKILENTATDAAKAAKALVSTLASPMTVGADEPIEKVLTVAESLKATKPDDAKKLIAAYDDYLAKQEKYETQQKAAEQAQATAAEKAAKANEDKEKLDLAKIDADWKDKPQVQAVEEVVKAKKDKIKADNLKVSWDAQVDDLKEKIKYLGGDETGSASASGKVFTLNQEITKLKGLLTPPVTVSKETEEKIKKIISKKEKEHDAAVRALKEAKVEKAHADVSQSTASTDATEAGNKAGDAEKVAKNFGVAGGKDLSDSVFLGVQKAVQDESSKVWTVIFEKEKDGVEVNPTDWTNKIQKESIDPVYGKFASIKSAYNQPDTQLSVYGYFDGKYYSVGQVATPEAIAKVGSTFMNFTGKSLLQGADNAKMVSDVTGSVNFTGDEKRFTGNFSNFQTYGADGQLTPVKNNEKLSQDVGFTAEIKGNTFKPIGDSAAKVYGYFYGDTEVKEAGGLVEYENVFHGSFGGALTK